MFSLNILQLFSRYLHYGGEEGSVFRIGETLAEQFEVDYFIVSSEEMMQKSRWVLPLLAYRNFPVLERLKAFQTVGRFDVWLIHNVFPAISPGAYALAEKLEVPIIHFLHNYRMGCVNGFSFTKGQDCHKCGSGNFIHGAIGKCWRDSYPQSIAMAVLLADLRRRQVFQQVRRWIAISHAQKEVHVQMGLPEEKIDVVHHFLERDASMEVPDFPADGYCLFIGRLSPEKGVNRLLDAWAQLGKNRRLVIAGDGPELASVQKQAQDLGLSNVIFAGFVKSDAQKELWAGAAFSVVPSLWREPFGMVVLEAWTQGRTLVAHRIGALPELINDGVDGFLADPDDASDLARVLEDTFQKGATLRDMGRNGLEVLLAKFNKPIWFEKMEKTFLNANLI